MGCKHFPLSVCKDCRIETLTSQVTRLRELCGEIWASIPDHVSYYDWCALKKRYEQRLKDDGVVK